MNNIVLYCKSYSGDINRLSHLVDSVDQFNMDKIPFYISVPQKDIKLFNDNILSSSITLIPDEEIYIPKASRGWIEQQIIKANFWRLNLCKNYLCLDSDSYFIKPFYKTDFLYHDDIPYTVMHEQKELFSWCSINKFPMGFDPKNGFVEERKKVMSIFSRPGRYYDFGPSPVIWSASVWKSLEENYMTINNLDFNDLITISSSEFSWYGEALLKYKSIPIYPCEPIFKVFHYPQQLIEYKYLNILESDISTNYLGIVIQSTYSSEPNYKNINIS